MRIGDPEEARGTFSRHGRLQLDLTFSADREIVGTDPGAVEKQLQGDSFWPPFSEAETINSINVYKFQTDLDGVWGEETDFQLSGSFSNQIKATNSEQDFRIEVTGSSILPIELAYLYHTNKSALEAQIQVN